MYVYVCRACKCIRIYVGMKADAAANPVVVAKFWLDLIEPHNVVPCCSVKSNMIANCEKDSLLYKENGKRNDRYSQQTFSKDPLNNPIGKKLENNQTLNIIIMYWR